MNIRVVAVLVVIAALVGVGGTLVVRALLGGGGESLPQPQRLGEASLEGVSLNELAGVYIYVSPPPAGYAPKVSSNAAKLAVAAKYPSVSARQVLLAHLETRNAGGVKGQVWIVNLDPNDPDLVLGCPGGTTTHALSFVDAESGHWLFDEYVTDPPAFSSCGGAPARTPASRH